VGFGFSGLCGIAVALLLSSHTGPRTHPWTEDFGFCWLAGSLGLLGGMVAFLPYAIYEWAHAAHTEYPDPDE
jgi:hypothetical protein